MKKTLWIIAFLSTIFLGWGQNKISGTVYDKETKRALSGAVVSIGTETKTTEANGKFEFKNTPSGKITLTISSQGFKAKTISLKASAEGEVASDVYLEISPMSASAGTAEISMSELDADDDNSGQAVSSLLTSSQDVFDKTAGFNLGFSYFRTRGYDNENNNVYINGALMNDAENGRASFSEWGGLNDAARNKEVVGGLQSNDFGFGSIGGEQNINMRASAIPKQHKLGYSLSNRSYWHRLMYTYGSGLLKNGWAFAASVSRRWGNGGYVPGTVYDGWGYFVAAEKRFGAHSINLTAFGSPTKRGQQGGSYQETYDLLGTNYYNPNWGYQDGKVRNARIRQMFLPTFLLTWDYKPSEKTKLNTTASYQFGRYGTTALNWYDAPDPRPDYYRYLPSYQTDAGVSEYVSWLWQNDPNKSQINWDNLYQANYSQYNTTSGGRAKYIVEDRRNDVNDFTFNSVLNHEFTDHIKLNAGLRFRNSISHNFKTISDLLGGKYWLDIDQFAERDFPAGSDVIQNDLDNPNRVVGKGDIFGYNYYMHDMYEELYATANFNYAHWDIYAGAQFSSTQYWREGEMRNGRAPNNSYGKGETHNFFNYGVKAGATYKINGRNYIFANVLWKTRAPFVRNVYLSPRIKDGTADLENEKIFSADINYVIKTPVIQGRITLFNTMFFDGIESTSFYHDEYRTFVNYVKTGVDKVHQGIELGLDVKIIPSLTATLIASVGNYRYTSRPTATVSPENGSFADFQYTVYQKNFYVSGTPQIAGSFGLNYVAPYNIYINAAVNYVGKMYLSFNPERRTELALKGLAPEDPLVAEIMNQEKLPGGFTLDASIGKSFRFKRIFTLNINVGVTNITNNKNIITGGYEQNRFDFAGKNVGKYPPRYFYAQGTTFFINASIRF